MRIYVQSSPSAIAERLFAPLRKSLVELGHVILGEAEAHSSGFEVALIWNGRTSWCQPAFCAENGWLPRSVYQIGLGGFNANHHAAPWRWTGPLSGDEQGDLDEYLGALRNEAAPGTYAYADPTGEAAGPGEPFLLAPFQMPQDVNMDSAPQGLRTPFSFARAVLDASPPWRVIFKQHPMDANHGNDQLALPGIDVWPHRRATIHQLLKSPDCRGVVTINSNVAHDALLWGVPVIVLGRGMWAATGGPFFSVLAGALDHWEMVAEDFSGEIATARDAYAHWLIRQQWTPAPRNDLERRLLRDASNPRHVAGLLQEVME